MSQATGSAEVSAESTLKRRLQVEFAEGWSSPTTRGGCWSISECAKLIVRDMHCTSTNPSPYTSRSDSIDCELWTKCYLPRGIATRRVWIRLGPEVVFTHLFSSRESLRLWFSIPLSLWKRCSGVLTIECESMGSPFSNGESADRRRLGVHIEAFAATICPNDALAKLRFVSWGMDYLARGTLSHLSDDPWANTTQLLELLSSAIRDRTPFSMIRLGDGEGRFFAFPALLSREKILSQALRYQFGSEAIHQITTRWGDVAPHIAADEIRELIRTAALTADVIGVPAPIHLAISKDIPEQSLDAKLAFLMASIGTESNLIRLGPHRVFDTYVFRAFSKKGYFDKILSGLPHVTIICHTDISSILAGRYGIEEVRHVAIPGHASFARNAVQCHYPDGYKRIAETLQVPYPGAVFLVGAGYLGKHYCNVIKSRGGIAIDIGSIFDSWIGDGRPAAVADSELFDDIRRVPP